MSMPMTETRQAEAPRPARDEERWQAVKRRDPAFDGKFFFAVRTTGIYCRPSCASRAAKRENVAFFQTVAQAEKAGFRACKRCRPDKPGAPDPQLEAVRRACAEIDEAEEAPKLAGLAASAGLSPYHFHRVFKAITGVTPKAYAAETRARRAADKLRTAETVTEAIYDAGFNSSSRFYENTAARLGMTPGAVRRGGAGVHIRFAVGQASLGAVLVAATSKGVCAILLGDDPDKLVRELQDRFPNAEFEGGDAEFERMVAEVVGLVEAPGQRLDLPLDIRGTAFQQRVWAALSAIPPGKTATYKEIARAIGQPAAVRAVAQACAQESARGRDPLPSGGAHRRRPLRLSLGGRAQARADRARGGVMKARAPTPAPLFEEALAPALSQSPSREGVFRRPMGERGLQRRSPFSPGRRWPTQSGRMRDLRLPLDWPAIERELDAYGCAVAPKLLSPEACRELQALYPEDARFRSRIVMAKHGFGKGEYKYFAYPLPEPIVALRRGLYARLAPIADRWNEAMGVSVRYPRRARSVP